MPHHYDLPDAVFNFTINLHSADLGTSERKMDSTWVKPSNTTAAIGSSYGGQDDLILSAKLIRIAPETSSF